MLPLSLAPALFAQLNHAREIWGRDRAAGALAPCGCLMHGAQVPASRSWFWVFPATAALTGQTTETLVPLR